MKTYEASAKTVEEAIELGLRELGVSMGDVEYQVIEEGSKGLFGLFGSRLAKVRLTVKDGEIALENATAEAAGAPEIPETEEIPVATPEENKPETKEEE